jgi:hypothetical protein
MWPMAAARITHHHQANNRQEMLGSPRPNGIVVPAVDQSQIGAS